MIRILLAEDQGMMRSALAVLLGLEDDLEVVAQVSTGDAVRAAARASAPDVALLDIEMPGRSGLDAAAELRAELPSCRVLILTTFGRPGYLRRAMESGASGFLVKDGPVEELAKAIRRVLAGERVVDPALAAATRSDYLNALHDADMRIADRVASLRDQMAQHTRQVADLKQQSDAQAQQLSADKASFLASEQAATQSASAVAQARSGTQASLSQAQGQGRPAAAGAGRPAGRAAAVRVLRLRVARLPRRPLRDPDVHRHVRVGRQTTTR